MIDSLGFPRRADHGRGDGAFDGLADGAGDGGDEAAAGVVAEGGEVIQQPPQPLRREPAEWAGDRFGEHVAPGLRGEGGQRE